MPNIKTKTFDKNVACNVCGQDIYGTPGGEWTYSPRIPGKFFHTKCFVASMGNASQITPPTPKPANPDLYPQTQAPATPQVKPPTNLTIAVCKELLSQGQVIAAIKRYRDDTNESLLNAKNAVEVLYKSMELRSSVISAPSAPVIPQQTSKKSYHKQLPTLLKLMTHRIDVYLGGAPGAGKTYAIKQAAKVLGLRYGYIALSEATTPSQIFGYMDATGKYVPSILYDFYSNGGILDIAELDNTNPNVFTLLNNALDNGAASFPCGMVSRHKDFVVVANGNTNLRGPNTMFPARIKQDAASIERFCYITWEYDTELELALFNGETLSDELPTLDTSITIDTSRQAKAVAWAQGLRAVVDQRKDMLVVSLRCIRNLCKLLAIGAPANDAVDMAIFKAYQATKELKSLCPITF